MSNIKLQSSEKKTLFYYFKPPDPRNITNIKIPVLDACKIILHDVTAIPIA